LRPGLRLTWPNVWNVRPIVSTLISEREILVRSASITSHKVTPASGHVLDPVTLNQPSHALVYFTGSTHRISATSQPPTSWPLRPQDRKTRQLRAAAGPTAAEFAHTVFGPTAAAAKAMLIDSPEHAAVFKDGAPILYSFDSARIHAHLMPDS
jgi:hypothetical protein